MCASLFYSVARQIHATLIAANGKNLTRVIKQEANVEKKALNVVIQELADLQRMQKEAVKVSARPSTYRRHS